jgi:hypothetical protein
MMKENRQFQFIEVVNELERVELAPLILPLMKIIDPVAKAVPEGAIKQFLNNIHPHEGQFDFINRVAPLLPPMIRWAGRLAAIKPLMAAFGVFAEALALVLRFIAPVLAVVTRMIISGVVKARAVIIHKTH